jgi:L-tartrate/succinate antiporter
MSNLSGASNSSGGMSALRVAVPWRAILPVAVAVLLALLPAPAGLAQHAWYYFAIFAGVIVALLTEPLPGGAVGLIGVVTVTVLAPVVFYAPDELAKPGVNAPTAALTWARPA